jgi:hypothetical protein
VHDRPHLASLSALVAALSLGVPVLAQPAADWPAPRASSGPLAGFEAATWAWSIGSDGTDWLTRVTRLRDGSLVAVGFVDRDVPNATSWDALAIRMDSSGRRLWTRRLGGTGLDAFWDVREDAAGRILLAGFTASGGAGGNDGWLVALDRDGRQLFEGRYGGAGDELILGMTLAPDGDILLVGQTTSEGAGERDVFLARIDPLGRERWRRTYGGAGVDRGFFVAPAGDGFAIAGVTGTDGDYDILTLKVDARGGESWRRVVGGPGNDPNHGLQVLADGRILVVGYAQSWGSRVHDLVALTYSPSGELLRHEVMGGAGDDRAMAALPDGAGGTLIVGYTTSAGSGDWDVMVARVGADGRFVPWIGAIGGAGNDHAYGGLVLPGGDLLAVGYTGPSPDGTPLPDLLALRIPPRAITRQVGDVSRRTIPE